MRSATAYCSVRSSARCSTSVRWTRICLSSTVPALVREFELFAERWAKAPLLVVGPGAKTGIPVRDQEPPCARSGPDRVVNAVAANAPATGRLASSSTSARRRTSTSSPPRASTWVVSSRPGSRSRWTRSSSSVRRVLMRVDFVEPPSVIGKTTVHSLQSGLVYGFAGQVDLIVEEIRGELGFRGVGDRDWRVLPEIIVPHRDEDRAVRHIRN